MQRISLSGTSWRFRDRSETKWLPGRVPGCVHTDLLAAGKIPDPFWADNEAALQWIEEREWEYETKFHVPAALLEEEVVELVADGLDTVATVFLNGKKIAETENMFVGYRWNVRRFVRAGKNELRVVFGSAMDYIRSHRKGHAPREFNDPVGRCTVIRKQQCQFGWDWGPRFVTAGVWRDIRLEAWSGNRLENLLLKQHHDKRGQVLLEFEPQLARKDARALCRYRLTLNGDVVAEGNGTSIEVPNPQLWWPNGHGQQPLYTLSVDVLSADGALIGTWEKRIGLRTIVLDRHPDKWGESFQFVVNGRPIFIKGANWIPAHCFVAGLTRADYERDLRAAVSANMNMARVWGGGIYESEDFYDLCDELGLLVWQDFMFGCTLYPADDAFVRSVQEEVAYQVPRIRHRACLALWCGNNEVFSCNAAELTDPAKRSLYRDYERLYHQAIPKVLAQHDTVTPYWPSSPWRGDTAADHAAGEKRGDTHYWDVWHARFPVKDYERWNFRFVSEFGMQSYSSPTTQDTFCPKDDANVFGPAMENHQKNRGGNQVIFDYVSRRYRFPKDQASLIYLSQLNQAYCMETGVLHYRRLMPRCMGAMYWQLNDCWPVASWSSIEFTGRWKALHFVARRFNAPLLITAHVPGDETPIIGNYRRTTVKEVHLYTVSDDPQTRRGLVRWDLFHVDGRKLKSGTKRAELRYGESVKQQTLDLAAEMEKHGRENIYLRYALDVDGATVSEDTALLTLPRFLNLPKSKTKVAARDVGEGEVELTVTSSVFQHRFWFDLPGVSFHATDNCFDLYPGEPKIVRVKGTAKLNRSALLKKLTHMSLVDTFV
jgi:beta-mannosidase